MSEKLPIRTKLGFGVCDLGGNLFFTATGFWTMSYLTDTVGLTAALAGAAILIGKLWDAVTDPMMGFISDRTRSRWGRRRPWMLFGAIPLLLSMWFFFTAPGFSTQLAKTVWAILALMLLNTAYTIVNVPYSSLTPELTSDYHERSSLNGFRFGFAVIGTILGAASVQPILGLFSETGSHPQGFKAVGLVLGSLMAVTALITGLSVREKGHESRELPKDGFLATYLSVFHNRPYLIVLFTYALNMTGMTFLQGILVYYTTYIYGNEGLTTFAMVMLLVVAMLCIPLSVLVSKKIGKKRTYQISFFILATACVIIWLLGEALGEKFFLGMMIYAGVGIGFGYVAPWSMVPDTIEYDAIRTGKRKEGSFYGMWTFISKSGQAIAFYATGFILSLGGYVAHAVQTPSARTMIKLLIGPVPALFLLGGLVLIHFYPLDEKTYERMIREGRVD